MKSEKALLRKYEDDLHVSGTGVIVMGAWSVVRVIIELIVNPKEYFEPVDDDPVVRVITVIVMIAFIALLIAIVLKIHLYIGLNAIKDARGEEHKKRYCTGTVIYTVFSVAALALYKDDLVNNLEHIDTTIAEILVDLTTIYILIVVVLSSSKIRKLREELSGSPEGEDPGEKLSGSPEGEDPGEELSGSPEGKNPGEELSGSPEEKDSGEELLREG